MSFPGRKEFRKNPLELTNPAMRAARQDAKPLQQVLEENERRNAANKARLRESRRGCASAPLVGVEEAAGPGLGVLPELAGKAEVEQQLAGRGGGEQSAAHWGRDQLRLRV